MNTKNTSITSIQVFSKLLYKFTKVGEGILELDEYYYIFTILKNDSSFMGLD